MTLFSLSFLFLFISWIHVNLENHLESIKLQEELKLVHTRIDIEEDIFDLVRQGNESGRLFGLTSAKYQVEDSILTINILEDAPISLEYDIMEDESFEWRKKYDSIE